MPRLPVIQPVSAPGGRSASAAPPQREAIETALRTAVTGEVRFSGHDRMLYATDASLYQVEPIGVVVPGSVEDAATAVRVCERLGVAILARGGGTSLAGQCTNEAVVIDFSAHCTRVRSVDVAMRRCVVDPGIAVDDLNAMLSVHRLFFAPDPATSKQANIGGCIGNNAAGARSIMYGRTSENIHAIDALLVGHAGGVRSAWLAKGAAENDPLVRDITQRVCDVVRRHATLIRERFPKTIRRNAGYGLDMILAAMDAAGPTADEDAVLANVNLAHLICGSEGTLAIVTGAELLLHPTPRRKALAILGFASVDAAIEAVQAILSLRPSAVELLDDLVISLAKDNVEYRRYVDLLPTVHGETPAAALYVEFFEFSDDVELTDSMSRLRSLLPGAPVSIMLDEASMQRAWRLRKAGEPLLHGMPGNRKPVTFVEDNVVPVENLGEFVRRFRKICDRHGTRAAYWAHASVGVLHIRPLLDLRDPDDERRMHAIAVEAADLARSLGGVMSGEHGDGRVRGPLLERFYGPELMRAFREIKAIFDPRNLLNPGNIVEPGPIESISQRTRIKPSHQLLPTVDVETYFEFADQHGLFGAVEMCNGAGVCRKRSGGTMCPSYMATLDERHATRGRANALRLAISGQLPNSTSHAPQSGASATGPRASWNDPETHQTLRLCLSCKACKAECPSNVDIARLKAEYTAQSFKARGGAPLAARMMGNIRTLNRVGSIAPGVANWAAGLGVMRTIMARLLNIDSRRSLPPFARSLAKRWRSGQSESASGDSRPIVWLFGDCFTMYNEPHIGLAARDVLNRLGYDVRLLNAGCCGRAMISMGVLDDAVAMIDETISAMNDAMREAPEAPVVFCEPSCLSAVKDDWLDLRLRATKEMRRNLAARSWLVEDFVEQFWSRHTAVASEQASDAITSPERLAITLHGHCHQKAMWGVESTAALLRRFGGEVTVLDSGCCGMAGSFGYMRDRYDLSMKIGERVLLPAVRAAGQGGAMIVAPGTSCRHQIKDATGAKARHPIEVVSDCLQLRSSHVGSNRE